MTWHADHLLDAYRRRALDHASTASIDTHLVACVRCQSHLRRLDGVETDNGIDDIWAEIVDEIDRPRLTIPERALRRAGVPEHVGRILAGSPALLLAAILALVTSLACAVLIDELARPHQLAIFVALAAVVPAVGVAVSFGAAVDPTYEIGAAAPLSGLRLVLVRTVAVVVAAVAFGLVGSLGFADSGMVVVAWLLPSLALAATTLALSTWVPPWSAASALIATWLAGVLVSGHMSDDWLVPFGLSTQVGAVAVIATALTVLIVRAPHLDHREI